MTGMHDPARKTEVSAKKISRTAVLLSAVLFISAALVYLNTLSNGFVYDDHAVVLANPWIKNFFSIKKAFTSSVWSFMETGTASNYYRPMMHVIYNALYHIFGFRAWGWHLTNVLLHSTNAVMVFLLALELTGKDRAYWYTQAFIGGLFFAWHPVNSEAVNWIASATELIYTLFILLSLYLYIRAQGKKGVLYALSVLAFFAAAFTKEPAVLLIPALIAYDYSVERLDVNALKRLIPYFAAAALYIFLRQNALKGLTMKPYVFDPLMQALTVFPVSAAYIYRVLFPFKLSPFILSGWVQSIREPHLWISAAATLAFAALLAGITLRVTKKAALCGALMILPILPTFYLIFSNPDIYNIAFLAERYLYLPMAGVAIAVSLIFTRLMAGPGAGKKALVLAAIILTFYAARTVTRNPAWKDDITLWKTTVEETPSNYFAHFHLGQNYQKDGKVKLAAQEYGKAIKLHPSFTGSHHGMGLLYYSEGRLDEAMAEFTKVLSVNPENSDTLYNMGLIQMDRNEWVKAIGFFERARRLAKGKRLLPILNALAVSYSNTERLDLTGAILKEAAAIDPGDTETLTNLEYLKEYLKERKDRE